MNFQAYKNMAHQAEITAPMYMGTFSFRKAMGLSSAALIVSLIVCSVSAGIALWPSTLATNKETHSNTPNREISIIIRFFWEMLCKLFFGEIVLFKLN